ncbi:hypothetical protein P7K49_010856 [Saguinus oedipus]|uniref:Uncharacterized protein n=1 Tax=Saguinus oedipus TaxID=9490 RepID=A0ABQ9VP00_SAGOE|nr:hypothetical protein P7K49_010856 [Saguinus oedipus]
MERGYHESEPQLMSKDEHGSFTSALWSSGKEEDKLNGQAGARQAEAPEVGAMVKRRQGTGDAGAHEAVAELREGKGHFSRTLQTSLSILHPSDNLKGLLIPTLSKASGTSNGDGEQVSHISVQIEEEPAGAFLCLRGSRARTSLRMKKEQCVPGLSLLLESSPPRVTETSPAPPELTWFLETILSLRNLFSDLIIIFTSSFLSTPSSGGADSWTYDNLVNTTYKARRATFG